MKWRYLGYGIASLICCIYAVALFVATSLSKPVNQARLIDWVNTNSQWHVELGDMQWSVAKARIEMHELTLKHQSNGRMLRAAEIIVDYNPWALLWATAEIDKLIVRNTTLHLPEEDRAAQKRKQTVSLRQLLLLRNISIDQAQFENFSMQLPKEYNAGFQQATFSYQPRLFRDVRVQLDILGGYLDHPRFDRASAAQVTLLGTTSVRRWHANIPYVNDVEGSITMHHGMWRETPLEYFTTHAKLHDSTITLNKVESLARGKRFQGHGHVDLDSTSSALRVEWVDRMPIPDLMHDESFLLTAGDIQGFIDWQGQGFSPTTLSGTITTDLHHHQHEQASAALHIQTDAQVKAGVIHIRNATLGIGNSTTAVSGRVDIPARNIDLQFSGNEIPIEGVLRRFRNPQFHAARGLANCSGTFRGWAKDYTLELKAETTGTTHYYDIAVERLTMHMRQTHPQLTLEAKLWQGARSTGDAQLKLQFGERQAGSRSRSTHMDLRVQLDQHDLTPSFAYVGLAGIGRGTLHLTGDTKAYRGNGHIKIREGAALGLPIEYVNTHLTLAPGRLQFTDTTIKLANAPQLTWTQALALTTHDHIRLHGTPHPQLDLDLAYDGITKQWTFHHIRYRNTKFGGRPLTINGKGAGDHWHIHVSGIANAAWLQIFPERFREVEGALDTRLELIGNLQSPEIRGTITLRENWFVLRDWPQEWSSLTGTLRFYDHRVTLDKVEAYIGDGPATITGWAEHDGVLVPRFDLHLVGRSLSHITDDRHFRMEFDADTKLTQLDGEHMDITGELRIVDALYDKDFHVLEHATQNSSRNTREQFRAIAAGHDKIRLNLQTKSQGEIRIRNNAADIGLRATLQVTGTVAEPKIRGDIESTDGEIHYLGLAFDITNGNVSFQDEASEPFVALSGEKNVGNHLVQITMRGPADNMQIDLQSIPSEDRRNVLCLIAYGGTCDNAAGSQFGNKVGPGVLVEQIGKLIQKPLEQLTGLDTVRVESAIGTSDLSTLHIGKRFSDRLEMGLVTTVGQSAAEQSIEASYQLTDTLLLKGQTGSNTGAKMSIRLRER